MKAKETVLKTFIRDEATGQPRGIALMTLVDGEARYGYSLLNTKMDRFNKKIGTNIALSRALHPDGYEFPETEGRLLMVLEAFNKLEARALKYFKDIDPDKIKILTDEVLNVKWTEPEL